MNIKIIDNNTERKAVVTVPKDNITYIISYDRKTKKFCYVNNSNDIEYKENLKDIFKLIEIEHNIYD